MVTLTRQKYKQIKSMNRQEMEQFLTDFQEDSYKSGVKEVSSTIAQNLINKVETAIKSTPGIGQKRFDDIMANITKEVCGGVGQEQEAS